MFESIAAMVIRRGWAVVLGWLAVAGLLFWAAPNWETISRDDDVRFFPPHYRSVIGQELMERGFPEEASGSQAVVIAERRDGPLTGEDFVFVERMAGRLREDLLRLRRDLPGATFKAVTDFRAPIIGPRLISPDGAGPRRGQAVLTLVTLQSTYMSKSTRLAIERLIGVLDVLRPHAPRGLELALTGSAAVGHDTNQASLESVNNTTVATVVLVVAILLLVYRAPLLALIPLLTIALSVWASLQGVALLTTVPGLNFRVIDVTKVFVIVVLFGAGTDYCLFLIARYREELVRGRRGDDALREAISQVGGALLASAGTVICGLGMLWFSSFAKIQYTGPTIALCLAVGLVAALTLAPVLLHWLRGAVFWPFRPPHHEAGRDPEVEAVEQMPAAGLWFRLADLVARFPGTILTASLLAMVPFAVFGMRTQVSHSQLADLASDQPSVQGAQIIQRYFPVGELGPTGVLIAHPGLDYTTAEGREAVAALSRTLDHLPGVAQVRSISQPTGDPESSESSQPAPPTMPSGRSMLQKLLAGDVRGLASQAQQGVQVLIDARYISREAPGPDRNHITKIDVLFDSDPFSPESLDALEGVRAAVATAVAPGGPLAGASRWGMIGPTSQISDLKDVTARDERRMYVLVTLGVYAILVVLLRLPGISLYLIATVILGYLASLGITDLVFRALHEGPEPWPGLDWKVGFFLFVILVAIGEDYNIFLMSRVVEEERKYGGIEGTRRAMAHTGGIISSCGLIMAGTFGAMLTAKLTALRELGFALALGVLLDTFVVRPILVPAFVILLHRLRDAPRNHPAPEDAEASTAS